MAAVDSALALALILCITVLIFYSDNLVMWLQWPVSFFIAHMLHLLLIVCGDWTIYSYEHGLSMDN